MSVTSIPRVVALLPAWNAAGFIRPTLDALVNQTYPRFEILVAVDLSADDTASICREYASRDPRIRVICQSARRGFVGNTTDLLRASEGEYVFWAWHDDLVTADYVSRLVETLEARPDAVCAFTDVALSHLDGRVDTRIYTALEGVADPVERARRVLHLPENWWVPHRGLVRRDAAIAIGGFRRHLAGEYMCDWPWALHMAIRGAHVRVPLVLCRKFFKPASLSLSWRRSAWAKFAVAASCAREVWRSPLSAADRLRLECAMAGARRGRQQAPQDADALHSGRR